MTIHPDPLNRRQFLGIAAGAAVLTRPGLADTPDSELETAPFSFAVIADPHCAEGPRAGIEAYGDGVEKLMRCFTVMADLPEDERPDFALVVGDIHPAALAPRLGEIACPLHVVAGNHESNVESRGLLRSLFPGDFGEDGDLHDYYSFVHKGVRFIGLCDAGMGGEHVGLFSSELITPFGQCDWLERELGKSETRKVVFAHIPPALDGGDRNMYMARNESRWFLDLVRRTTPEMLFFGHLHQGTETYQVGETQGFNLRSCCWNFQEKPLGFMLVQVKADGMTTREVITGAYA